MSDEQVMDQVPGGDTAPVESKEPVGDKPAESTKSASIPKSFDDMTEDQKQLYLLGAQHHKQYSEQEAAKKAKEAPAKKAPTRGSDDDPNTLAEREVGKLIDQAMSEAGEGADGRKVLTKAMTKLLMTSTGLTQQMIEDIAEQKVAGLRGAIVDSQAETFFKGYKYLDSVKPELREVIEKYGVPVDLAMKIVEGVRPKQRDRDEEDEDYDSEPQRGTVDRDDWSFLETPSRRGDAGSNSPSKSRTDKAAEAAKAAVAAQEKGDTKARDAALKRYLRLRPRAA